jgi:hypothetical protein
MRQRGSQDRRTAALADAPKPQDGERFTGQRHHFLLGRIPVVGEVRTFPAETRAIGHRDDACGGSVWSLSGGAGRPSRNRNETGGLRVSRNVASRVIQPGEVAHVSSTDLRRRGRNAPRSSNSSKVSATSSGTVLSSQAEPHCRHKRASRGGFSSPARASPGCGQAEAGSHN